MDGSDTEGVNGQSGKKAVVYIDISKVRPGSFQTRSDASNDTLRDAGTQTTEDLSETDFKDLKESIRREGLLQPIGVRKVADDEYEVVWGHMRRKACEELGYLTIPCLLECVDDDQAELHGLMENALRRKVDWKDEARSFRQRVARKGISERKLAAELGVSHRYVQERIQKLKRLEEEGKANVKTPLRRGLDSLQQQAQGVTSSEHESEEDFHAYEVRMPSHINSVLKTMARRKWEKIIVSATDEYLKNNGYFNQKATAE